MKYKEFNEIFESNYKRPISDFKGPYIKSTPEIRSFDIAPEDEYIVIATDGLWDFLNGKDVAKIISSHKNSNPAQISNILFDEVMQKVSKETSLPIHAIMSMPSGGKKRRIHDDISLIVFDLKH